MKNVLKSLLLVIGFGAFLASCGTDPCSKDSNCGNGTCNSPDGKTKNCLCDACFEKDANGLCTVAKDCGTFGSCDANSCVCDTGYEQDTNGKCEVLIRQKFIGQWNVADVCSTSGTSNYNVTVLAGTGSNLLEVRITNFWGTFANAVTATVDASGTITITRQQPDNDNYFVVGSGAISSTLNTITFTYTITQEDAAGNVLATDACNSVTWTKI